MLSATMMATYLFHLPSSWWPWRLCTPGRWLLPLSISLKVPGHQANYSPPYGPWKPQAPANLVVMTLSQNKERSSTQSTAHKMKHLQPLSWTWTRTAAGLRNPWSPSGQGRLHHHLLPPRTENLILLHVLSLDDEWDIDTASQVLRFDPFCKGSRWLGTIS